ncbi:MAG: hypothetical protein HY814_00120 [Candidatus Riflebacteria bacterium]|nr:hypothetical protein [Candidatus Riflebacteria bacterium]
MLAAFGLLAAGRCPAGAPMIERYLLPIWYTAVLEPTAQGNQVHVQGRLSVNLAPMGKASVKLQATGLRIVSCKLTPTGLGDEEAAAARAGTVFEGDLPAGSAVAVEALLEREGHAAHGYVTLVFEYDVPTKTLESYVEEHATERYPDPKLRRRLLETIRKSHTGRRTGGVTERIELERQAPK